MPHTRELLAALRAEPALQVQLCAIYAQDMLCLPYELPAACKALLTSSGQSDATAQLEPSTSGTAAFGEADPREEPNLSTAAAALLQRLRDRSSAHAKRGFLFGHHRSTESGVEWQDTTGTHLRSDVHDVVGDYPALVGWDLGDAPDATRKPDTFRSHVLQLAAVGGISTYSWHMRNPLGDSSGISTDLSRVLPGGDSHDALLAILDPAAAYLRALPADVPILLRPYHEMNKGHFWWGASSTPEQFVALWRFTVRHLRVTHGVNNVLFVYSPAVSASTTTASYLSHYPGDDVVDLLALDAYEKPRERWPESLIASVQVVASLANERAKPWAISEVGPLRGLFGGALANTTRWWTERLLRPLQSFYETSGVALPSPAYVMAWGNFPRYFYVPYPRYNDSDAIADFRTFASDGWPVFLRGAAADSNHASSKLNALELAVQKTPVELDSLALQPQPQPDPPAKFEHVTDATSCQKPADGMVWLMGAHHRTGTLLTKALLAQAATATVLLVAPSYQNSSQHADDYFGSPRGVDIVTANGDDEVSRRCRDDLSWSDCVALAASSRWGQLILAPKLNLATADDATRLAHGAKIVHWMRDPIDAVISGYFYNMKTTESWARVPDSPDVAALLQHCQSTGTDLQAPLHAACAALEEVVRGPDWSRIVQQHGGISYQQMLALLPRDAGILFEAHRTLPAMRDMNATYHALSAAGLNMDLDEARRDCHGAFSRIFEFLEVEDARQPTCEAIGCWLVQHTALHHDTEIPLAELARLREWLWREPLSINEVEPLRAALGYHGAPLEGAVIWD